MYLKLFIICLQLTIILSGSSIYALSGACASAAELQEIRDDLRADLESGQKAVLVWCVCREQRNKILYWGEPIRHATGAAKLVSIVRSNFRALAGVQGGCFKRPVEEIIGAD